MKYQPRDIQEPGTPPYLDTLGKSEWEEIAAHIITESQKAGTWVRVTRLNYPDIKGMKQGGKLEETAEGYHLTEHCIEEIWKKYHVR